SRGCSTRLMNTTTESTLATLATTHPAASRLGASFSALEVVPLVLIGLEAFQTYRMQHATTWMTKYRWPIRFFVAVAFWNLVGAGLFGFLINPPIALYYMQGWVEHLRWLRIIGDAVFLAGV